MFWNARKCKDLLFLEILKFFLHNQIFLSKSSVSCLSGDKNMYLYAWRKKTYIFVIVHLPAKAWGGGLKALAVMYVFFGQLPLFIDLFWLFFIKMYIFWYSTIDQLSRPTCKCMAYFYLLIYFCVPSNTRGILTLHLVMSANSSSYHIHYSYLSIE